MNPRIPPPKNQIHLLDRDLPEHLCPEGALPVLVQTPQGQCLKSIAPLNSAIGGPAKPLRLMVGLLFINYRENFSDERMEERGVGSLPSGLFLAGAFSAKNSLSQ